jgi:hypothetical protein
LPVLPKDVVYWDAGLPGFGVKVTPKGRKVFIVMYRLAGAGSRLRKYTIGPYGRVTLPMARAQAQKIFAARLDGRDPAEEKKQSRRRLVVDGIDDLVETDIRERVSRIRTAKKISNAWCWRRVARLLTRNGHEVFTPTLTAAPCSVNENERGHKITDVIATSSQASKLETRQVPTAGTMSE